MPDQQVDPAQHGRVGQLVDVIQHQDDRFGEGLRRFDQPQREPVRRHVFQRAQRFGRDGPQPGQPGADVGPEPGLLVLGVQGEPDHPAGLRRGGGPGGAGHGLPGPGRAGDQRHPVPGGLVEQAGDPPPAQHREVRLRDLELAFQEPRALVSPAVASRRWRGPAPARRAPGRGRCRPVRRSTGRRTTGRSGTGLHAAGRRTTTGRRGTGRARRRSPHDLPAPARPASARHGRSARHYVRLARRRSARPAVRPGACDGSAPFMVLVMQFPPETPTPPAPSPAILIPWGECAGQTPLRVIPGAAWYQPRRLPAPGNP